MPFKTLIPEQKISKKTQIIDFCVKSFNKLNEKNIII